MPTSSHIASTICIMTICVIIAIFLYKTHKTQRIQEYMPWVFRFDLYNMNNSYISNTSTELEEQEMLCQYVKKTDHVLQLGGNIGTSCITVDKIVSNDAKAHNVCVEPSDTILPVLQKNKEINNAKFTILDGILTKSEKDLRLEEHGENLNSSTITEDRGNLVRKYPFSNLNSVHKFNVIFADCEGCFPAFIEEFKDELQYVKTVIYEKDYADTKNYSNMEQTLHDMNFKHVREGFVNVWQR